MRIGALFLLAGCSVLEGELPEEPPPLEGMEEPLPLFETPDDEARRVALEPGGFTGVVVGEGGATLENLLSAGGVLVERVVENSPGAFAGIEEGDLLVAARLEEGEQVALSWPGQWRELELAAEPGRTIAVRYDRAGVLADTRIEVAPRLKPADRGGVERYREEERVGVVVRTATEVEARAAGLPPGGGAVVVGLARNSPWRAAGVRFSDLIVEVDGERVHHPLVVLDTIRRTPADETVDLAILREGARVTAEAAVSERAQELKLVRVPVLFRYRRARGEKEWSVLLGLVGHKKTTAAWETRLLWVVKLRGGDAEVLEEVDR